MTKNRANSGPCFYGSSGGKKYPASLVCPTLWFSRSEAVLIILMAAASTILLFYYERVYELLILLLFVSLSFPASLGVMVNDFVK